MMYYKNKAEVQTVQHFMDLFKKMLMVDNNWRITPLEALQHPFFSVERHTDNNNSMAVNNLTELTVVQTPFLHNSIAFQAIAPGEETIFTPLEDKAALIQPG